MNKNISYNVFKKVQVTNPKSYSLAAILVVLN